MPEKGDLLSGRFDERIAPVEVRDGKRQARKAGARPDVGDREALQMRQHRERIEQVLVHDVRRIADRGQVEARVPVAELGHERQERVDLAALEREAERLHARQQPRLDPAFHVRRS